MHHSELSIYAIHNGEKLILYTCLFIAVILNISKLLALREGAVMQDRRDEDLKAVLTKDQYKLYEEKKDEIIGNMKEKYKNKQ